MNLPLELIAQIAVRCQNIWTWLCVSKELSRQDHIIKKIILSSSNEDSNIYPTTFGLIKDTQVHIMNRIDRDNHIMSYQTGLVLTKQTSDNKVLYKISKLPQVDQKLTSRIRILSFPLMTSSPPSVSSKREDR